MERLDSEETLINCWNLEENMLLIAPIDVIWTVDGFYPATYLHPRIPQAALR